MNIVCPKCNNKLGKLDELTLEGSGCLKCDFSIDYLEGVPILYNDNIEDNLNQLNESSGLPTQNSDDLKIPIIQEALASGEWVLELGAGVDVCTNPRLIKSDAYLYSTDLHCLADAHSLPFEDNTFGYVYSLAVFEHLHSPWVAAEEIFRVLKPGGKVYVLTAFMQHMHGYPNHYFNMTLSGLKQIFKNFEIESSRPSKWSSLNEVMYIMMDYVSLIKQSSANLLTDNEMNLLDESFSQICSINSKVDRFVHENADFSPNQNWAKIAPAIDIIARKPN
jgi:SAM-dependent methyltransferase